MITKINFDGADRLAIVFSPYYSIDEVYRLRSSLLSLISFLQDDFLSNDLISPVLSFIEDINSTEKQFFEMYKSYFDSKQKAKDGIKNCKIITE